MHAVLPGLVVLAGLVVLVGLGGCGEDRAPATVTQDAGPGCLRGTQGCLCTLEDGCESGLLCIANRCLTLEGDNTGGTASEPVRPPSAGGSAGGGSAGGGPAGGGSATNGGSGDASAPDAAPGNGGASDASAPPPDAGGSTDASL
jgi:hypothetical protein